MIVLGTGVPEAVLSAALSRAGQRVLHVDEAQYYGSEWASLTLTELCDWAAKHGATVEFGGAQGMPDALAAVDRHYSLSVRPALLPAHGPMIEALVRSNVAAYATFRLLERVGVFDDGRMERVPSSKSEIFRHKGISLPDKRRLMRFLQLATEAPPADEKLADVLQSLDLAPALQRAVQYGVCLAWNGEERADTALARTRQALQGLGRYGDAAYLVGQYGGAGELAQGFCRASAVKGGTFILGHAIESLVHQDGQWVLRLADIDTTFCAKTLACTPEAWAEATRQEAPPRDVAYYEHLALVVTAQPIDWARLAEAVDAPPETALVVLPPGSVPGPNANAVLVLMQGEGTFSCPKGQYVYYLVTHAATDAPQLQSAVELLLTFLEEGETQALVTMHHARPIPKTHAAVPAPAYIDTSAVPSTTPRSSLFLEDSGPYQPIANLTETLDRAVEGAEHAFWQLFSPDARTAALDAAYGRKRYHDPADYQGRGGAEPELGRAPPKADVEFLAPEEDES